MRTAETFPLGARLGDSLETLVAWREVQLRTADLMITKAELERAEAKLAAARRSGALKAGAILPPSAR